MSGLVQSHNYPPTVITASNTSLTPLLFDTFYVCNSSSATTQYLPTSTGSNLAIVIDNIGNGTIALTSQSGQFINNGLSSLTIGPYASVRIRDTTVGNWIIQFTTAVASGLIDSNAATWSGVKTIDNVIINNPMPSLTGFRNVTAWLKPILQLHIKNQNVGHQITPYVPGVTAVNNAYAGACYSPAQNRIYFAPYSQGNQATWHYIDCNTGNVIPYTTGVSPLYNMLT